MYEVILYQESTDGVLEKIKVKSNSIPIVDEEGRLNFYNNEEKIYQFNEGTWQYWKKVREDDE